jgi:5'-3' exonuclease
MRRMTSFGALSGLTRRAGITSAFITRASCGVKPKSFADYLELTGVDVDNFSGVPGRTAAALVKAFGSIDTLYGLWTASATRAARKPTASA